MHSSTTLITTASLLASTAIAGWSASSNTNIALYWGQDADGQLTGVATQQNLATYCSNTDIDVIPIAFLDGINNPTVNFANSGNACTAIAGTNLLYCPQIGADITECQNTYGKTILLSIGGATYSEGGFTSTSAAQAAAQNVWALFGPVTSIPAQNRPFGTAVVNGFDFDFESSVSNMPAFANELRTLMNAAGGTYYLSAAPQCPYPDAADGPMLAGAVSFDFIWVQFYNNYCEISSYVNGAATQNNFNFATWDNWAKTVSLNPNVKVFLGIPGQAGAGLAGYENGTPLQEVIAYSKGFSTFAGVMIWDMSLAYANTGFLNQVISDVGAPAVTQPTTTAVSSKTTSSSKTATTFSTVTTTTGPTTTGTVGAYDQCGGTGYTGSTACIAGYTCTEISAYWSQCDPSS